MSTHFNIYAIVYALSLTFGLLIALKIGHLVGKHYRSREKEAQESSALDGVVFALLGLLLAFCFSSALTSYGARRDLLTREAHDTTDFHAKLDLLPEQDAAPMRVLLREYAEARLEATQAALGSAAEREALQRAQTVHDQM